MRETIVVKSKGQLKRIYSLLGIDYVPKAELEASRAEVAELKKDKLNAELEVVKLCGELAEIKSRTEEKRIGHAIYIALCEHQEMTKHKSAEVLGKAVSEMIGGKR